MACQPSLPQPPDTISTSDQNVTNSGLRPPRLTPAKLKDLALKMRNKFKWGDDPRPFQLQAVQYQLEAIDTIIQAPTGSGKTAIAAGPHVWLSSHGKISIMVSPLLALEEEMVGP